MIEFTNVKNGPETPFKAFENIDSVLAITDDFNAEYRILMEKAHLWMYQQIVGAGRDFRFALAGPFSYNFMLKHLKTLPKDTVYIIADVSVRKLEKLQKVYKYFSEGDIKLTDDVNCGETTGNKQHFARQAGGEKVAVHAYCGIKENKQ